MVPPGSKTKVRCGRSVAEEMFSAVFSGDGTEVVNAKVANLERPVRIGSGTRRKKPAKWSRELERLAVGTVSTGGGGGGKIMVEMAANVGVSKMMRSCIAEMEGTHSEGSKPGLVVGPYALVRPPLPKMVLPRRRNCS